MENTDEVLKIKQVLLDGEHETDLVLADSLTRLHRIYISCHTLLDTMIGEPVCVLRKTGRTSRIRLLADALVTKWKRMIDEWIADGRLEIIFEISVEIKKHEPTVKIGNNQIYESPNKPMIQNLQRSIQDDNNQAKKETEFLEKPKKDRANQEELRKSPHEIGSEQKRDKVLVQKTSHSQKDTRKTSNEIGSQQKLNKALIQKKPLIQEETRKASKEIGSRQNLYKALSKRKPLVQEDTRKASNEIGSRQNLNKGSIKRKPLAQVNKRMPLHGIGSQQTQNKALVLKKPLLQQNKRKSLNEIEFQPKPKKPFLQKDRRKALDEMESQQQSNKSLLIQKKPFPQEDNINCVDNATRLEATRKRLRENYEQAEKAKRQRKIQVVELHNLSENGSE